MRVVGLSFFIIVSLCYLSGCGNDATDIAYPQITVIETLPTVSSDEVCGEMSDRVIAVAANETLSLTIRYSDDIELAQAKLDIHSNFDCHGHGKVDGQNVWQVLETIDLGGSETQINRVLTPPDNVRPGDYHLGLMLVDASGNSSAPAYYDIKVYNNEDTVPPIISLDSPNTADKYDKSQNLLISGTVTDETEMAFGEITISLHDANGMEFNIIRNGFGEESRVEAPFSFEYGFPAIFTSGTCSIRVEATDGLNNQAVFVRDFTVVE